MIAPPTRPSFGTSKIQNIPKVRFGGSSASKSAFPPEGKMNRTRNAPDRAKIKKGRLSPAFP
jgi:hypothetical protein